MSKNFLKYTGLTYDQILSQVNDKLNADEKFANFRESSIAQTLIEIFASTVDLCNFYIERRAEESFFDTARLRSSVMLLARSLGYVIQRPIPASARLKMKIKGKVLGDTIQVPINSVFSFNGFKFILKNKIIINSKDYQNFLYDENLETPFISVDYEGDYFEILQGELKEKVIEGSTNPQIGSTFQIYRIEDKEFSNLYGEDDLENPLTRVWVGDIKSDETEYDINRRSLIDWKIINAVKNVDEIQKVCVIRTSISEEAEILFGDGKFAEYGAQLSGTGAKTSNDDIYIQYLATKGSQANQVGVKDKKIQFSGKVFDSLGNDITSQVDFYFDTNITGGADIEDIESIRVNAPNIYYSLDRLVSKDDYINYLKSLTSPINVKNAIAWGEQEELKFANKDAILKMFNVVFFSVVGSLYQIDTSPHYVRTKLTGLDDAVLDFNYDDDTLNQRNYFNVYLKEDNSLVEQLKEYQTSAFVWKIQGDDLEQENDGFYFSQIYGSNAIMRINYTTDLTQNNIKLSGSTDITVDVSPLSGYIDYDECMQELSNIIQPLLRQIIDERGINNYQNKNKDELAFSNITFEYDVDYKKFVISHESNTSCYIYSITSTDGNSFVDDLKIGDASPFLVNINRNLSKKIVDTVDDLDSRSQITIRNIYISPIIQTMNLEGIVYLKNLYDISTEKVNIEDEIYEWFDLNADFNKEIYISNVVELIEQFPSVLYADVKFIPDYPEALSGNFYNIGLNNHHSVEKSFENNGEKNYAYSVIDNKINQYLSGGTNKEDVNGFNEKYLIYGTNEVQNYSFTWNNNITERTFLEVFAKGLYDEFKSLGGNYYNFVKSDNFIDLVSDIRKDYLKIIRFNLLDTNGNIAKDNQIEENTYIKGGYSLGSEIIKVNIKLSYEYKR